MSRHSSRTRKAKANHNPALFLSLGFCLLLWIIHLTAQNGLQPDLTGSSKDMLLLAIAAGQLAVAAQLVWRWFSKNGDRLLFATTLVLTLSFAIWLMDAGFQDL